jgi:hypothetical protein
MADRRRPRQLLLRKADFDGVLEKYGGITGEEEAAVDALETGRGDKLLELLRGARDPEPMLEWLAARTVNDRTNDDIGRALVGASEFFFEQKLETLAKFLPAMAIGAVHEKHANGTDTSAVIKRLKPLVAKRRFEAQLIAAWAWGLTTEEKKYAEALDLIEIAIACRSMGDTNFYVTALWLIQEDNTKIPLDEKRARRFLRACLPRAKKNPAIYHNAACVFAELGDVGGVIAQLRAAKESGYHAIETMKRDCVKLMPALAKNAAFRKATAKARVPARSGTR